MSTIVALADPPVGGLSVGQVAEMVERLGAVDGQGCSDRERVELPAATTGGDPAGPRTHHRHVVQITTPTGHHHTSPAPELIPADTDHSRLERHLEDLLRKAG